MTLSLPMVGVGLSYTDLGQAAGLGALMVVGSLFGCLVSLRWPEHHDRRLTGTTAPGRPAGPTLEYGLRLGAAGATAAAIGFLLNLEHVGWACAAALLVMRPAAEMQRLRSVGRILSVIAGALIGVGFIRTDPSAGLYGAAAIAAVAGAAATHHSRWYVSSAFTTFIVCLLLLCSNPQDARSCFDERVLETLLGVALAYAFGLGIPVLLQRHTRDVSCVNDKRL